MEGVMSTLQNCGCGVSPKAIFSCSGAADVGELTDRVARSLMKAGNGKMFCLAGIGGNVSGIIKSTEAAPKILVIDGCGLNCTKKTLEAGGFTDVVHLNLMDLGFKKGETDVDVESISKVVDHISTIF
jgi:uncharacterized metal-binding protein